MIIRTLRYFLAVAREENMTRAAGQLHVTQPTLSKTLKALEDELGKKLFTRHSFSIRLTDEGVLLRKRAEDLVSMADRITREFVSMDDITGGKICFGLAESHLIQYLAREIREFRRQVPDLRYHITSGDTEQVTEKLDKGLLDFAVLAEAPNAAKYEALAFPEADVWGLVFQAGDPLSQKPSRWMISSGCPCSVPNRAGRTICPPGAATGCGNSGWKAPSGFPATVPCLQRKVWGFC